MLTLWLFIALSGSLAGVGQAEKQESPMVKRSFKLAMVQMLVEGGEKQKNLDRAEARIREASAHGATIVLLPEAMDLGWTHPSATRGAEPIPGGYAGIWTRANGIMLPRITLFFEGMRDDRLSLN
jgi:hypothetical protein